MPNLWGDTIETAMAAADAQDAVDRKIYPRVRSLTPDGDEPRVGVTLWRDTAEYVLDRRLTVDLIGKLTRWLEQNP